MRLVIMVLALSVCNLALSIVDILRLVSLLLILLLSLNRWAHHHSLIGISLLSIWEIMTKIPCKVN